MIAAVFLLAGCASQHRETIPTYPLMDVPTSLATIQSRNTSVKSMSGEGAITLTDARGRAVRLDGAFALMPPDRARVRAWKFGQAVLDITITPEGTWVFSPRREGMPDDQKLYLQHTGDAIRQWVTLLSGGLEFDGASSTISGNHLTVTRPAPSGLTLTTEINRDTLTPRQQRLTDQAGRERFILNFDWYQTVDGTVWPQRIEAKSDTGKVLIEVRSLEANTVPASAFQPPARAVKVQ